MDETWKVGDEFIYNYKAGGYSFQAHDGHHAIILNIRSTGTGVDFHCLECGTRSILAFWREMERTKEVPM